MKALILSFLFTPVLALALDGPKCRFSKKMNEQKQLAEHHAITVRGCNAAQKEKDKNWADYCNHVVICGKLAKSVTCKSKEGRCEGYDANWCVANQETEPAEYETQAPAQKTAPTKR